MVSARRRTRWGSLLKSTAMGVGAAGIAAVVMTGCGSSHGSRYDHLDAQTSRPGWAVGDMLGQALAPQRMEMIAAAHRQGSEPVLASGVSSHE
jgi:hypothetical protein